MAKMKRGTVAVKKEEKGSGALEKKLVSGLKEEFVVTPDLKETDVEKLQMQAKIAELEDTIIELTGGEIEKHKPNKVIEEEKEIRWRKTGGGSFRLGPERNHKIIKQNQVFSAKPSEIPVGFRDTIKPVDKLLEEEGTPVKSATHYKIKKVEDNLYDVVNAASGKPMNQKPFDLEKANSLLEALS